jgi:hypothetical protein
MSKTRGIILFLLLANVFEAGATYVAVSMAVGAGKLQILSTYRELDLKGVVNRPALKDFRGGTFVGHWALLPEYLGDTSFSFVELAEVVIVSLFILNAAGLALLFYNCQRTEIESDNAVGGGSSKLE